MKLLENSLFSFKEYDNTISSVYGYMGNSFNLQLLKAIIETLRNILQRGTQSHSTQSYKTMGSMRGFESPYKESIRNYPQSPSKSLSSLQNKYYFNAYVHYFQRDFLDKFRNLVQFIHQNIGFDYYDFIISQIHSNAFNVCAFFMFYIL